MLSDEQRERTAFVLVEPREAGNVGAVARALKNTGFRDLRIVGGPDPAAPEARRMAWRSLDVLEGARRFERLADATADRTALFALTARPRRTLAPVLDWPQVLEEIARAAAEGPVGLLFGREDRGLERSELEGVRAIAAIPSARERPVYNLAQAVLLVAFALFAGRPGGPPSAPPDAPENGALTAGERRRLLARLRRLLVRLGYDRHPDPRLLERILARADHLLERARPVRSDEAMLHGILQRLERELGGAD